MEHRSANCFSCQARKRNEWCTLEGEDLQLLQTTKICNLYQPGHAIFYQGNPCLGVYCIEAGTVALRKTDAAGNSVLVRLLTAGETLGYRAYFAGETYSSTAEALTPARVCFIDKAAVARMLERNPAIGFQFLRRMGEDLREAEDAKLHATALSVRARLAHLLLTLKNRFGRVQDDGTLVIELPLSRQDLAAMVGTRPETIARTIKSMETDEVAIFEGRTVKVSDLDSLLDELEA